MIRIRRALSAAWRAALYYARENRLERIAASADSGVPANAMLMEDGTPMLMEDGSYMLTES